MDAFFASIERIDTPSAAGKPIIVGGPPHSRGVVASCSYEARQFGVHAAMSSKEAVARCPDAVFVRPRHDRYQEISTQIMNIFHEYTDLVEPLSIDEAFLDVTENFQKVQSATRLAQIIRQEIMDKTSLSASAGISYNKFLAKVASDINKPNGQFVISPQHAIPFLHALPIRKFYGVGRVTEKKMLEFGIRTGKELAQFSREDLATHFGKTGSFFYSIVRGIDTRPVTSTRIRKSLGNETTFASDTNSIEEILAILQLQAQKLEETLTEKRICAAALTLKIRYCDFTTITRSTSNCFPITTAPQILSITHTLMQTTDIGRRKIRLIGIALAKLRPIDQKKPYQLQLPFSDDSRHRMSLRNRPCQEA